MARPLLLSLRAALALLLGGLLANCQGGGDGSGGSAPGTVLYFSTSNFDTCEQIEVDVDLPRGGAELVHRLDGSPKCSLVPGLSWCDALFDQSGDGRTLRATISNCEVPTVTGLFHCQFTDPDVAAIQQGTHAECECSRDAVCWYNSPCDQSPPTCVSADSALGACEDCRNGVDDDADGLVDCDDPNCFYVDDCGPWPSTVTCPTMTTTTEMPSPTTTLEAPLACSVRFRLLDDVTLGSLQWDTDYGAVPGDIAGYGGNAECVSLVPGSLSSFHDQDEARRLDSVVLSLAGFTGPLDVAECRFSATSEPKASDFQITITDASDPDLARVEPLPDLVVGAIECARETTTSTTTPPGSTVTSSSLAPTVSDTIPDRREYAVLFRLATASGGVGSLQWSADYSKVQGSFHGSGATVACANKVPGTLFAPNDADATRKLTLGIISLSPFSAPADLVECTFDGFDSASPSPKDFALAIEDATDTDGNPVRVAIDVTVTPTNVWSW